MNVLKKKFFNNSRGGVILPQGGSPFYGGKSVVKRPPGQYTLKYIDSRVTLPRVKILYDTGNNMSMQPFINSSSLKVEGWLTY